MITTPRLQLASAPHNPPPLASKRERLVRAADRLWRVHDITTSGRIIGHLREISDPLGCRYRAERLHLPSGTFRFVGEFWRPDDAVQALRNG